MLARIPPSMLLGCEVRKGGIFETVFRQLDRKKMETLEHGKLTESGLSTIQNTNQAVKTLSDAIAFMTGAKEPPKAAMAA